MSTELINHLRAGFPCFWIPTNEPDRVKTSIQEEVAKYVFSIDGTSADVSSWNCLESNGPNPALKPLNDLTATEGRAVKFLYNYHWFIDKPQVIQTIQESFPLWANEGKAIVVVAPVEKIPEELKKDFTIIDLPLPGEPEILEAIHHASPDDKFLPTGDHLTQVISDSKSLTRRQLHNVYSLALVKSKSFDVKVINDYRSQMINKTGLAKVLEPTVKPEDVVGYEVPKQFVLKTINNPEAKGIIFIGPPGCGKTQLVKSFAYASKKLTLLINTGALFSKYQGETDKNVRTIIDMAWALGNCYFVFDEMEKQFSGVGGNGDLDSGVTSRAISQFLEFFQNRPPGCYCGATANSFVGLPPEYLRAGRWDTAPVLIDLPGSKTRKAILKKYISEFKLSDTQVETVPKMDNWSGSEIETLCHNARMLKVNLVEASQFVLPLYATMKEEIQGLRDWAKGRTIAADAMEIPSKLKVRRRKLDV